MILIIGSLALNAHKMLRQPKDIDVIASYDDAIAFLKEEGVSSVRPTHEGAKLHARKLIEGKVLNYEVELAWPDSTAEALTRLVWTDSLPLVPGSFSTDRRYAPLNALYALKMSHRYRKNSPHFRKTMDDIHAMRALGASIPADLQAWFKAREKETYTYSHPKLNTTKNNFFADDGVPYKYDHDSIHDAIKIMDKPAFDFFKPDTAEVLCSKEMFFKIPDAIRLNAVYEESAVLALERSIVPHPGVLTPENAFAKSLEKVCSSITSGWFREYAWENHGAALALYERMTDAGHNYVSVFERKLKEGVVKPYTKA